MIYMEETHLFQLLHYPVVLFHLYPNIRLIIALKERCHNNESTLLITRKVVVELRNHDLELY